ncbi:MAG: hypothetical protein U0163_09225 [Gemmatimonadaceae bacterium]
MRVRRPWLAAARSQARKWSGVITAVVTLYVVSHVPIRLPWWKVDRLHHAQAVRSSDGASVTLTSGRRLMFAVSSSGPLPEWVLASFTSRGVEVNERGEVFGLVEVHHWCGMDVVQYDLERVNVRDAMTYMASWADAHAAGRSVDSQAAGWASVAERMFSPYGWRAEVYQDFVNWNAHGYSSRWMPARAVSSSAGSVGAS